MRKQTIKNNNFLKEVKMKFNSKIFKSVGSILNEKGHEEAVKYLQSFSTRDITTTMWSLRNK